MKKNKWLSDKNYEFIYTNVPRICIDLVLIKDNYILLIKRDIEPHIGKWHIPGGAVLFGENINDSIQRLAKIEIGNKVKVKKLLYINEMLREKRKNKIYHSIAITFLVEGNFKNGKLFSKIPCNTLPEQKKMLNKLKLIK